ncbi:MAG: hypothetical protein ACXVCP_20040, partial [Bdellovibrio sp.]
VCDPFSDSKTTSPDDGLLARLILRSPEMTGNVDSVMDYIYNGQWTDQKVYFASVNVPTRDFTKGFVTLDGQVLKDDKGNKLIQDFALEYTSVLQLSDTDKEGEYQIALLTDDGSRLFVKENESWNELVNNDGSHLTRMGCPYRTIHMDKNSRIPIKLVYYQGSGPSLANVMAWRHYKHAKIWKNPARNGLCGFQSDKFFFNPKKGKDSVGMMFLKSHDWKILQPANFKMPQLKANPCVSLAISNFGVESVDSSSATLIWNTNLPASSQLQIISVFTSETMVTPLDQNLVTDHKVVVSGLRRGSVYKIQAISVDAVGNSVVSDQVTVIPR